MSGDEERTEEAMATRRGGEKMTVNIPDETAT